MILKRYKRKDKPQSREFRTFVFLFLGIIVLMILVAAAAFLLTMQGAEKTMIPDVTGETLESALIKLQDKELNSRIQLQYSSNPSDKGNVLAQEPLPGALVRAGSHVMLKVSKGAVIDRVENYIGWKLSDLEIHLQTLFTTHGPLLRIKRPVMKIYNEAEPDTILEQKPAPGTELTGLTDLELVVSRGPKGQTKEVPQLVGMEYTKTIDRLLSQEIPFVFSARPAEGKEKKGVVVSQDPAPGTEITPKDKVTLVMTEPDNVPDGMVFGVLERTLPDYPIIVDLKLEAVKPDGERTELMTMKDPGGKIGIPYMLEENTMLILSVFDNEIIRYTVRKPEPEQNN